MMASRGMGAMAPSKMPKGKTVERKDNPNKVSVFKKGGKVACGCEGGAMKAKK